MNKLLFIMLLMANPCVWADIPMDAVDATQGTIRQIKNELESVDVTMPCDVQYNSKLELSVSLTMAVRVITFSGCGGGNHYTQYAILVNRPINGIWNVVDTTEVGNDFQFSANTLSHTKSNKVLIIHGLTWGKQDAHCCPSVPLKYKYNLAHNRLESIN